jgi:hypothetical protein
MKMYGGVEDVPAALPPGKDSPARYPLDRRLGGPQSRSGRYGEEKSCLCQESNPGSPARSLSLYRLSYPGSICRQPCGRKPLYVFSESHLW